MNKAARARVVGPLAPYADGFRSELAGLGYTPCSGENHVWVMAHLSRWLVGEGLEPGELDSVRVEQFRSALRANGQKRVPNKRALAPLAQGPARSAGGHENHASQRG